jgi:hypothetical protein
MMKHSLMKVFFDSVTSDGHSQIADEIVTKWLSSEVIVSVYEAVMKLILE